MSNTTDSQLDFTQPNSIPKERHSMRISDVNDNALSVLKRLNGNGYDAYLVGGCIRDKLLGKTPKDFDIATNATPEQIKALFRNCRLIGRRFRLAHIVFGREIIEVATFRGHHRSTNENSELVNESNENNTSPKAPKFDGVQSKTDSHGQLVRDNVYGNIYEDAERRDFSFNAMYFDIRDESILDFANGLEAINKKCIEIIGDTQARFKEDPVRMLRAVRFKAKLNMEITSSISSDIKNCAHLLSNIPPARLFEEMLKLLLSGHGLKSFWLLKKYGLFELLFPQLDNLLADEKGKEYQFTEQVLKNTDNRIINGQRVTPAFIFAAFLWYPVEEYVQKLIIDSGISEHDAFNIAVREVMSRQVQRIMIPKRFSIPVKEIWYLQKRFTKRFGKRPFTLTAHPRFRAGFDFLEIRGQIEGGELEALTLWWKEFQESGNGRQKQMIREVRTRQSRNKSSKHHRNSQNSDDE